MGVENNKLVAQRFVQEILAQGNVDLFEEIIHHDYEPHTGGSLFFRNRDFSSSKLCLKDRLLSWFSSFNVEILTLDLIGENNTIIAMMKVRITQIQEWNGLENKNQSSVIDSVRCFTFKEGLIVSMKNYNDYFKFWYDLGHGSKFVRNPDHDEKDYLTLVKNLRLDF